MLTLTSDNLDFFVRNGYLRVENLLDPEKVIDPIIEEYSGVLSSLADELFDKGKISSKYAYLDFSERVTQIYEESNEVYNQYFDFSLPQSGINSDTPFWAGPAVFRALTDRKLLDFVEMFIGAEIYSNPVQHVRIKVPETRSPKDESGNIVFGATPWHQDNGVITEDADNTDMLTVWFPLMDADEENGCLQVVPGSHKHGLVTHCPGYKGSVGTQIPEQLVDTPRAVPMPIKKGGVLFLHKKTVHSALPNVSDRIRWSFDLRYQPIGQPTGRASFPGFVARSKAHPEDELRSPEVWEKMWTHTRDSLANSEQPRFNRWNGTDAVCA